MKNSRSLLQTFPGAPCHPKHIYHTQKYSLLPHHIPNPTPPPLPPHQQPPPASLPPLHPRLSHHPLHLSPISPPWPILCSPHGPSCPPSSPPNPSSPPPPHHPTPQQRQASPETYITPSLSPAPHISFLSCCVRRATPHRHLPQPPPPPPPPTSPSYRLGGGWEQAARGWARACFVRGRILAGMMARATRFR